MGQKENALMQSLRPLKTQSCSQILDGKTYPIHGHAHYVPNMCGGATLTRNGHCLDMKHIAKIISLNLRVLLMTI
jgi:hypothetical protein